MNDAIKIHALHMMNGFLADRVFVLAGAVALVGSCAPSQEPMFDPSSTEAEVRIMFDQYASALRTHGLLHELPYLDTSAAFFWVPPGYSGAIGLDSIRTILERNAPALKRIDPHWSNLRIEPLNDSLAAYTGQLESVTVGLNNDTMRTSLLETGLVVKRADGWKLLCGQTGIASAVTSGQ